MNRQFSRKLMSLFLVLALTLAVMLPASAFLLKGDEAALPGAVATFSKNGPASGTITFGPDDFVVEGDQALDSILLTRLPELEAGVLTLGDNVLTVGDAIGASALGGLKFQPLEHPTAAATSFSFTPVFADGSAGHDVSVNLYLLTAENGAPIAENLEFTTYKNVAITERFSATDPEGDLLTFRLVDKPARGSVAISEEEGSADFVYTPFENKTGKDSFTYVAVDAVGNTSAPATVKIRIEKANTKVTYTDMEGLPAYKAAIRLAEEGVFVGECMNGEYFFRPDQAVSRNEFVAMALKVAGQDALTTISRTGFSDDAAIPTWAKGYVSSALKSGVVQGTISEDGQVVFQGSAPVTRAEASVLLNRVLRVSDVSSPTLYADSDSAPAWAYQAAVNLETAGVLRTDTNGALSLSDSLTRANAADLLTGAMDLLDARESGGWFH